MQIEVDSTKVLGALGAMFSLAWVKGTWPERIILAIGGATLSLLGTDWVALKTGLPPGLTGFLVGLLGMALCAKVLELIQATPITETWAALLEALKKRLGGS